jgi:hypothetical protein
VKTVVQLFNNKKHLIIGILAYNLYFFIYYWSIGYLQFTSNDSLESIWLANPLQMIFRSKSPFLYEAIGRIDLFNVQVFVAPINILIGLLLGLLVMLNILAALYMYSLPKQCRLDYKVGGIWGILPSFLTGFACCAPSFLIPLSSLIGSSAVFATKVFRWFLPLSLLLLVYGFAKSYQKIKLMTQ